jgi:hypothetical protein
MGESVRNAKAVESNGILSVPRATVILISLSLTLAALFLPTAALGAKTHVLDSSFETKYESSPGVFSPISPRAIAVDESTGSLYVLSESPARLTKYDEEGNPANFSVLGTNTINLPESFAQPRQIAVDNSGGINDGVIYIGRSGFGNGSTALVYLASGSYVAEIQNSSGSISDGPFCGMALSPTGDLYVSHTTALLQGPYIDKYHPGQWRAGVTPEQTWPIAGTMIGLENNLCKIAVDSEGSIYTNNSGVTGSSTLLKYASTVFDLEEPPHRSIDNSSTYMAVDTSGDDVYSDRNNSIARFDSNGTLREVFGTDDFEQSAGVAIDGDTDTAYVSVRAAGGTAKTEVKIYKAVTTPDVSDVTSSTGQTSALVGSDIGTAGAGAVTDCELEYGTSSSYGAEAACIPDATGTPYTSTQHVTVDLSGLEKEMTYHYRLTATNANGTTKDIDRTFTTHNVADVSTDEPTEVTQTSARLNGSFTGNGEATTYYFDWGESESYGNQTAVPPGEPAGSATGHATVTAQISGLSVYLPDSPAYHYRLVATNASGTTYGPDREFHTMPPELPVISETAVGEVDYTSATLSAMVNPQSGPTVYSFDYGLLPTYGFTTPTSESIGEDEADHPVSAELEGLDPGVTYHFRAVATNFGGTTYGPDETFMTPVLPTPKPKPQPQPQPAPQPQPSPEASPDCSKLGARARTASKHAKRLRQRASRVSSRKKARSLRRRARRLVRVGRKWNGRAKACRTMGAGG